MIPRTLPAWLLAGAAALPLPAAARPEAVQARVDARADAFRFHADHVLGTSLDVVAVAPDAVSARLAAAAVRGEIERLDPVLSAWRADGGLARLNRNRRLRVAPELFEVLEQAEELRAATGGAFDCRAALGLASARLAPVELDPTQREAAVPDGASVTLDGIAKGYVIDAALAAARRASPGLQGLMIDIGGDLRCWGRAPHAAGWRIGLASPGEADNEAPALALRLAEGAVAFSGRGARDLTVGGARVSHIVDPRTGRPASVVSAVASAPTALQADALATAFMVMAPRQALAFADARAGVEALVTDAQGRRHASAGWRDLLATDGPARLVRIAAAGSPVPRALGLELSYEVPRLNAQPYHPPYVVAWLTDENRQLVRTLLMLGAKPKWVPENYIWWRRYGRQTPEVLDTVARPTRPPGRYTARWDGRDEAGKTVPPGRYVLHVEASREKGGHTYQTVELDLSGAPGARTLPVKDEMGAIALRFGPGS